MATTYPPVIESRTLRIEGSATLLSSLSHGGTHAGTVGYLRRERIVQPDGAVEEVPVVSGNALRGLLRDHAAEVFWAGLGRPALPPAVFHLLWSGGSLAKTAGSRTLSARQLAEVRRLIPLVSLFGGSGAGRIIEGKLAVGKLVPVCVQTAHLLPPDLAEAATRDLWDHVQIEEYTRRDDAKRDRLSPAIVGGVPAISGDGELGLGVEPAAAAGRDEPAQQMRYGVETLAAGTRLHWWMRLSEVTDPEIALLGAALEAWSTAGSHIGGRSATGHGRLRLDVHQWQHATPTVTVGQALAVHGGDPLAAHLSAHGEEIMDALGWFAA